MVADGYDGPILVSEGDSWFQYPIILDDTIDQLYEKGFAVRSLDAAGDTLENMLEEHEYIKAIREERASIFLLSAGGNDALGGGNLRAHLRDFDPALSPAAHVLPSFEKLLDHALAMYERVLREVEAEPGVVTICHGYDYVIPNAGKWLGKPMESRGITDGSVQRAIAAHMIDRFNERLRQLTALFGERVIHVDARGAVGNTLGSWHDELHPKNPGYGRVADRFEEAIRKAHATTRAPRSRGLGAAAAPTRRGWSLHVGVNHIDPAHYGSDAPLYGCHFDAEDMERIAAERGFEKRTVLLDEQATRDEVRNTIAAAAAELKAGDVFMFTYAGHGSQVPDFNSDEDDGADETLCLFDGMLIDDELYELWSHFADDVRIVMISDSCHSGTVSRAARRSPSAAELADAPPPAPACCPRHCRQGLPDESRVLCPHRPPAPRPGRSPAHPRAGHAPQQPGAARGRLPGQPGIRGRHRQWPLHPGAATGVGRRTLPGRLEDPRRTHRQQHAPRPDPAPHPDRAGTGNAGSAGAVHHLRWV
jgi:lysophospholipase L1-like esterase